MLLVGIDEAGYGPLLGPLVVSSVAMSVPDEVAGISLWQLFNDAVTDRTTGARGRLIVTDSKKLFHGQTRDLRELERSALAAVLLTAGAVPEAFDRLVVQISLEPDPHLAQQWYCHEPLTLPHRIPADSLRLSAGLFGRELAGLNAKLIDVAAVPLVEKRYNILVRQTKNKSELLFSQAARLIDRALSSTEEKQVRVCVDKQGGKDSYTRNLLRAFPTANLSVVSQGPLESEYVLTFPNRSVRISFTQKGEQKHLLIAWASIVSKYLRELFMIQFNRFWSQHDPNLTPTAGYWEDGQRFIRDLTPTLTRLKIPQSELIRQL